MIRVTLVSCHPQIAYATSPSPSKKNVAQWARIEAARRDTSVSRLLGALLKELMSSEVRAADRSVSAAAERLASFGRRHKLSLRGLKVKDLINEGRR